MLVPIVRNKVKFMQNTNFDLGKERFLGVAGRVHIIRKIERNV